MVAIDSPDDKGAFLIPAYNPGQLLLSVVTDLLDELARVALGPVPIVILDDGCTDGALDALPPEITIIRHQTNQGKGAALQTGFCWAEEAGVSFVVSLDADNQHPAREAVRLFTYDAPKSALVLAVRDLKKAGAPKKNQLSNAFSNWILSLFGGQKVRDTQCGLRRYPVKQTCALGATHPGYAFESDLVLRAARTGMQIFEMDAEVLYPDEQARVTHFDSIRDPAKNVFQIVRTTWEVPHHRPIRRWARRVVITVIVVAFVLRFF